MTQATDTRLIERALRRIDGFPQTGSGTVDAHGRSTVRMNPAPQVLVNPDGPDLVARIESLRAEVAEASARLKAVRHVIEVGYPGQPQRTDRCEHLRFGWEDCVECYDNALLTALGDHQEDQVHDG